ncbi:hypothetical protein HanRHA438_Chr16g0746691 [Helianthus annuus]|nr:hypothetical protein HanPSC8_Chr16g0704311 [Helianthus annuus]KAJ0834709.1 hypothetical protein HanRHA438_Chr16g0746691 [Helianthus annuus]
MVFLISYEYVVMCTLLQLPSYLRVATIIANQFVLLLSKKGWENDRDVKHLLYNCQVGKRPQLQVVVQQTTASRKISFAQLM